jgi:hypothetical protein
VKNKAEKRVINHLKKALNPRHLTAHHQPNPNILISSFNLLIIAYTLKRASFSQAVNAFPRNLLFSFGRARFLKAHFSLSIVE